jgi:sec-independent protein translocase protein TatA
VNIGPAELIVAAAVIVLLFGAKKLPELARSLGQAKAEFQKGTSEPAPQPDDESKPTEPTT